MSPSNPSNHCYYSSSAPLQPDYTSAPSSFSLAYLIPIRRLLTLLASLPLVGRHFEAVGHLVALLAAVVAGDGALAALAGGLLILQLRQLEPRAEGGGVVTALVLQLNTPGVVAFGEREYGSRRVDRVLYI